MNDYVSKPVEERDLYSTLLKWIEPGEREISGDEQIGRRPVEEPWEGMPAGITGIDLTAGLARIQGNTGLYKKMLRNFMKKYERATEEIKAFLNEDKIKGAERLIHSIKGISGNIGANDLFLAARDLNDALRLKKTNGMESLLELFFQRLSQVMESLEGLDLETDSRTSAAREVGETDLVKIASILNEMHGLLEKNSSRARHGLGPLKEFLRDTPFRGQLDRLEDAIYMLDKEKALSIILEMAKGLHISLKEEKK